MNHAITLPNIPPQKARKCASKLQAVLDLLADSPDPDVRLFYAQENSRMQRIIEATNQPQPQAASAK